MRASIVSKNSEFSNTISMFKAAKHVRVTLGRVASNTDVTKSAIH